MRCSGRRRWSAFAPPSPPADAEPPAPRKRRSIGWLELAAGIAVGLLLAGAAFWVGFGPGSRDEQDDWRQAVVEYMELYTPDTFALANPDSATEAMSCRPSATGRGRSHAG